MAAVDVSIIIPALTKQPQTLRCIPPGFETVVVTGLSAAKARNLGARSSSGETLIFMDDDIQFPPPLLSQVISSAAPKTIVTLAGTSRVTAVNRRDFQELGGFDENIPYCVSEDTEFFWRAKQKGLRFIDLPLSLVEHLGRHPAWKKRFFHIFNSTYVWLKHRRWRILLCVNPPWLLIRWVSLIYWLPILLLRAEAS